MSAVGAFPGPRSCFFQVSAILRRSDWRLAASRFHPFATLPTCNGNDRFGSILRIYERQSRVWSGCLSTHQSTVVGSPVVVGPDLACRRLLSPAWAIGMEKSQLTICSPPCMLRCEFPPERCGLRSNRHGIQSHRVSGDDVRRQKILETIELVVQIHCYALRFKRNNYLQSYFALFSVIFSTPLDKEAIRP